MTLPRGLEVMALLLALLGGLAGYSVHAGLWAEEPGAIFAAVSPAPRPVSARASPAPPRALRLDRLSALLGLPLRDPESTPAPSPAGCGARDSRLKLKLLGTLTHERGGLASLEDLEDSGRVHTVFLGGEVRGARLVEITRTRVVFLENGCEQELTCGQAAPSPSQPPPAPARPPAASGQVWDRITPLREGEYELPRSAITEAMSGEALLQARAMPYIEGGRSTGFRVVFRPDSPYTRLGLQSGDVLTRINGYSLATPEGALDAYAHLRDAQRVDLEVMRGGQPVRRTYWIR